MRRLGPPVTARPVPVEPSADSDPFVDHVRAAYCFNRDLVDRRRDGAPVDFVYCPPASYEGRASRGPEDRKRPAAWCLLAEHLSRQQIDDPYQFVALAIRRMVGLNTLPPEPLNLKAQKYLLAWRKRRYVFASEFADAWLRQTNRFRRMLGTAPVGDLLVEDQLNLSPLFRVCLAEVMGQALDRFQERLLVEASRQYSCRRLEYDHLLGATIPLVVRRTVDGWAMRLKEGVRRGQRA